VFLVLPGHGGSVDHEAGYDTVSFLRLAALARRFRYLRPSIDPRHTSVLWGHMLPKDLHWSPSGVENPVSTGASYPCLAGMGFLLSSALVRRLTAPGVRLAHGVAYPYDDVMHGAWVAEHAPDTDVIDDPAACHPTHDVSTAAPGRARRQDGAQRGPSTTTRSRYTVSRQSA
jgi:hypothetical protein